MRSVLQRVTKAAVSVGGETVGEIGRGMLVLVGVERGDGSAEAAAVANKLAGLRIFTDPEGLMENLLRVTTHLREKLSATGERDVELSFAGISVRPGDVLAADGDGVVVLPEDPGDASAGPRP